MHAQCTQMRSIVTHVHWSMCLFVATVSCAETDKPIEMRFAKADPVPVFPGQSRFGTLCPGIPNVVFGTPKCPGLAPDVQGRTELNPHNQLSLSV